MSQPYHVPTIRAAIARSRTLVLETYAYRPREREYLDEVLGLSLEAIGRSDIRSQLAYCIHELASNAKRANTKRVYFLEQGLDLNNPRDYELGMRRFMPETVRNIDHYVQRQRALGLAIRFRFERSPKELIVTVSNDAVPTRTEWDRIQAKLSVAACVDTLPAAYARIEDSTEGAGLGIVMMVVMLRNLGLSQDCLTFQQHAGETRASLAIEARTEPMVDSPRHRTLENVPARTRERNGAGGLAGVPEGIPTWN